MYFDTKKGPVWEPNNPALKGLFEVLEKNAPTLEGSRLFEDLVDVYESLDIDLEEDTENDKAIETIKPVTTQL